MAFTVKKGDLVYTSDATLGFVEDVFRPRDEDSHGDTDAGWAAVRVPEVNGLVYFTAADVRARDEAVPSVLLTLTHAEATTSARRREPRQVAKGQARADEVNPLDVGRPEKARASGAGPLDVTPNTLNTPEVPGQGAPSPEAPA